MTDDFLLEGKHSVRRRYPSYASVTVVRVVEDIRELGDTNANAVPAVVIAMMDERENFIVSMIMDRNSLRSSIELWKSWPRGHARKNWKMVVMVCLLRVARRDVGGDVCLSAVLKANLSESSDQ